VNNRKAIQVMLFALAVFSVFLVRGMIQRRDEVRRETCHRQIKQIEGAKEQFAIERDGVQPTQLSDLFPAYLPVMPVCPSGGDYLLGDLQTGVVCSVAAHVYDWAVK